MTSRRAVVCGAGLMGHGIAQVLAATGRDVALYEPDRARAEAGRTRIAGNLERSVSKGRISAEERDEQLGRVRVAESLDEAADAELVVEAIIEDEGAKRALFAELDGAASPETILASNTSSISITRLATATRAE